MKLFINVCIVIERFVIYVCCISLSIIIEESEYKEILGLVKSVRI